MKLSFSMKPAGAQAAAKPSPALPFGADDDDDNGGTLPTTAGGVHRPIKRPRVVPAPSRPAPPPPSSAVSSSTPSPTPTSAAPREISPPLAAAPAAPPGAYLLHL